jgi:hypothetical protein
MREMKELLKDIGGRRWLLRCSSRMLEILKEKKGDIQVINRSLLVPRLAYSCWYLLQSQIKCHRNKEYLRAVSELRLHERIEGSFLDPGAVSCFKAQNSAGDKGVSSEESLVNALVVDVARPYSC